MKRVLSADFADDADFFSITNPESPISNGSEASIFILNSSLERSDSHQLS